MSAKQYVVLSGGVWLRSLVKALAGEGTEGGAFTTDPRKARKYASRKEANRVAKQIYMGYVREAPRD